MKISLNWVKDFVTIPSTGTHSELVEKITLSVCEVEGYEETGTHLKTILVAEVKTITPHPEAKKLSLVTVDYGHGKATVVCGASNFEVGDKVAYAPEGTCLPGGTTIEACVIRGVESRGMLCAEDELGLTDDHSGLFLLARNLANGLTLDRVFADQIDVVMEIDNKSITHRPDLWGHYGFARELGAIFRVPVKPLVLNLERLRGAGAGLIDVEVKAGPLVPRFTGISVDRIKIAPSPDIIRFRLARVGLRPINNMVDLTNYVMLEVGQPMHAFDADQIAGHRLVVRPADEGTRLMTLYQKEVTLGPQDMTICDANGASVVAGVIGGLNTGVTADTTAVFLDAANWDPTGIRKTSTRIGLRTDACQRFEKALDPEITVTAIQRALEIMQLTNSEMRVRGPLVDIINKTYPPITIRTSADFIRRRLGHTIETREIVTILSYLGFEVRETDERLRVEVPSYRRTKDVSLPEDLVEEIGRIYGYNHIPAKIPQFPIQRPVFNRRHQFERLIKNCLSQNGFHEIYNYPLTSQKTEDMLNLKAEGIMKLINPVADHQDQMRTSLLPHFMQTLVENQKIDLNFKIFEIGRVYHRAPTGEIAEPLRLLCGASAKRTYPGASFYTLKSDLIRLLSRLQLSDITWTPGTDVDRAFFQHSRIFAVLKSGPTELGRIYALSPQWMDRMGLREEISLADLDGEALLAAKKREYVYQPAPRYPSVFFELSLVAPQTRYYSEIREIICQASPLVVKVDFLDAYWPKDLPGKKSLSVSMEFRSEEKTLEPGEIKQLQDTVISRLAAKGYSLRESN